MDAGTVIKWNNFPFPRIGDVIKPRWFVCLGSSGALSEPVFLYLYTTTTNIDDFEQGGKRERHTHCHLRASDTPFDEDCVLDIDVDMYTPTESQVIKDLKNIEVKGRLNEQYMRMIYNLIIRSSKISKKIKIDIHDSFNKIGITGLKMPK